MHVCSDANRYCVYECFCEARSPVFSHLSSSLQGLSTIRAFKVQQRFQQMFDEYQDLHSGQNNNDNKKKSIFQLRVFFHFFIVPFQSWSVWCFYTFKCKWNGGCRDFTFYLICVLPNRGLVLIPDHFSLVRRATWWNLLRFCHHHCFRLPLPPGWYCHVSRTSLDDTPKKTTGW